MKKDLSNYLNKIADALEKVAKKHKKKPGHTYEGWLAVLQKKDAPKKTIKAFQGRWKGALEYAEKHKDKAQFKAKKGREEYAARVAIDKLPAKYLKEPTKVHGPGKSGPIKGKKKK